MLGGLTGVATAYKSSFSVVVWLRLRVAKAPGLNRALDFACLEP